MRVVVPAGYMPTFAGNAVTIALCSGYGPMKMSMPGTAGMAGHQDKKSDHGKSDMPCGFTGLSMLSLAGTDPVLLALAVAFIVATTFLMVPPSPVVVPTFLRPPLRGPPTAA